jgi:hypothetical protein
LKITLPRRIRNDNRIRSREPGLPRTFTLAIPSLSRSSCDLLSLLPCSCSASPDEVPPSWYFPLYRGWRTGASCRRHIQDIDSPSFAPPFPASVVHHNCGRYRKSYYPCDSSCNGGTAYTQHLSNRGLCQV